MLKDNVNKIDGLQQQITEVNFPLIVVVDGFEFEVAEDGTVTYTGQTIEVADDDPQDKLPENTASTPAGTPVKLKSGWYTTTSAYYSTSDGKEVKKSVKVASVTAIATGGGESVPVPEGFHYVGGTLDSGVVISSEEADKNKYAGQEDVGKDLVGNQFVWIPVTAGNYKKVVWKNGNTNLWNATYDTTTNGAELPQIQKYGGFYIGRYEAGKGTVTSSNNVAIGSDLTNSGWTYSGWSVQNYTISGNVSSKADETPYYHADYYTAAEMSNRMYTTDYVQSGLVTGTQWDAMMNFIKSDNETSVVSSEWGNYLNKGIELESGKYRVISSDGSETSGNKWTDGAGFTTSEGTQYLLTTGSSETAKKKNLYDVAGNLWEWTTEATCYSDGAYRMMLRGGGFGSGYGSGPASYRAADTASRTSADFGFRVALYIK